MKVQGTSYLALALMTASWEPIKGRQAARWDGESRGQGLFGWNGCKCAWA